MDDRSHETTRDAPSLFERHAATTRLDDITLDQPQRDVIRSIAVGARGAAGTKQPRGRTRTASERRGVTVLFTGSDGTARENAAAALADELGVELYRVDVSQVV